MRPHCLVMILILLSTTRAIAMSSQPETPAIKDAELALQSGDKRLLALSLRALSIPGIDPADYKQAEKRCGIRFLDVDDVVESNEEIKRTSDQIEYAERYNLWMREHCLD